MKIPSFKNVKVGIDHGDNDQSCVSIMKRKEDNDFEFLSVDTVSAVTACYIQYLQDKLEDTTEERDELRDKNDEYVPRWFMWLAMSWSSFWVSLTMVRAGQNGDSFFFVLFFPALFLLGCIITYFRSQKEFLFTPPLTLYVEAYHDL